MRKIGKTGVMGTAVALLAGFLAAGAVHGQGRHAKEYWRKIQAGKHAVPEGEKAFALAKELSGYLKLSDSELRDDLAYSILYVWIVDKKQFSAEELLSLEEEWCGNLRVGIGENGTDSVFGRSFSALSLSLIAERELRAPFLGEARYRVLLEAALNYLKEEKDLRGFDENKGWIHATAHTADLLEALARHALFAKQDQVSVLKAVGRRIETAQTIFAYGEQDRLANVLATMAKRKDFDAASFAVWIAEMDKADSAIWKESPPKLEGLQRFENDSYLLSAFVARVSVGEVTSGAEEAKKAALGSLKKR